MENRKMKIQTDKPWLDSNGNILSDKKIKAISKEWSAETWEEFLNSTVDVEASEHESLTPKYEILCDEEKDNIWGSSCPLPQAVQDEIRGSVRKLEERPRKIVRLHYWGNLSVREIGKTENLSFCRVQQIKKESLSQIKGLLENALHTPSYLIGGSENFDLPASRDEDIKTVYRTDLEGSYLK